jgi:hypothetical protein
MDTIYRRVYQSANYLGELSRRDLIPVVQPAFLQLLVRLIDLPLLLAQDVPSCSHRTNNPPVTTYYYRKGHNFTTNKRIKIKQPFSTSIESNFTILLISKHKPNNPKIPS